jgi:hypothetical protein
MDTGGLTRKMVSTNDLPLILGALLLVSGLVYAGGIPDLPGLGNFDNPIDNIYETDPDAETQVYDLKSEFRVSATAVGDVSISGFTYQTPSSATLLSAVGGLGDLSLTGASDLRVSRTLTNTDTGKIYLSDTVSYGDVAGGEQIVVSTDSDNLKSGNYELDVEVTYDPSWFDPTDIDNTKQETFTINVPKVSN